MSRPVPRSQSDSLLRGQIWAGGPHQLRRHARPPTRRDGGAGWTAGMATCTLSHLTELWSSRNLIGTLTGRAAMPQLLIRVGEAPIVGEVPPMTPRRPVRDVLTFHRDTCDG